MEKGATSYKIDKLRRNHEMDEYDLVHWRRSVEEREALLRDISWYSFKTSHKIVFILKVVQIQKFNGLCYNLIQ